MISFMDFKREMEAELGRKLYSNEVRFLQWMYERYTNEQLKNNPPDLFMGLQSQPAR